MKRTDIERIYANALNALVDALFEEAAKKHLTWSKMAKMSGLTYQTIRNLGERKTKYPQYRTVQLLAHALGGKVQFSRGHAERRAITWNKRLFAA